MRDDALRSAPGPTTPATAWRRIRAIVACDAPWLLLSACLTRAALRAVSVATLGMIAGTAAQAAGTDCQHATFEGASVERMTVCVRRQAFDNDVYVLRLDGHGVFGRVGNRLVAMRCEAEASPARVSPGVAQALSWQTGVRVQRITAALGSVETGRRCTVKIDGADAGLLTFAFN